MKRVVPFIRRCLGDPLLHFLILGLGLFTLYDGLHPAANNRDAQRIEITPEVIQRLEVSWFARWQRPPSEQQLQGMLDEYLKEEILYREALKLGLDKNDTIIRRRLAQKMDFLAEDVASLRSPTPAVLERWYAQHQAHYAPPALVTFHHQFFASDKHGPDAHAQAQTALSRMTDKHSDEGDAFMFNKTLTEQTQAQVGRRFGSTFATALFQQPTGRWVGPLESGYGWHLVWVEQLTRPPAPPLENVSEQVKADWLSEQRNVSKRSQFNALKAQYELVILMPASAEALLTPQSEQP